MIKTSLGKVSRNEGAKIALKKTISKRYPLIIQMNLFYTKITLTNFKAFTIKLNGIFTRF